MRGDEAPDVQVRRHHDESASGEALYMQLDQVVQATPAVPEKHGRVPLAIGGTGNHDREGVAVVLVLRPAHLDGTVGRFLQRAFRPPRLVMPVVCVVPIAEVLGRGIDQAKGQDGGKQSHEPLGHGRTPFVSGEVDYSRLVAAVSPEECPHCGRHSPRPA